MTYKNCRICKEKLTGWRTKYCSDKCSKKSNLKRAKERYVKTFTPKKFICNECGSSFLQKTWNNNKFCGSDCNRLYQRRMYYDLVDKNIICRYMKLRFEIFKRDEFRCQYCGRNPKIDKCKLVIDHIIPKSKGGKSILSNLITSCNECNSGKTDILLKEHELSKLNNINIKNEIHK